MKEKNKILISPLDWGLGHSSRIIPIINLLIEKGDEVIIAANGDSYNYLKQYFKKQKFIKISGYNINYSQRKSILKLIFQIPKILIAIIKEHKTLKKIIKNEKINCVISDNRYGLWNKKIKSIFITHQINIKAPKLLKFTENFLYKINKAAINKFDYCLIPDEPNSEYTGELTSKYRLPKNATFIGLLSRFIDFKYNDKIRNENNYKIFIILSGAEPQKTEFLNLIIKKYINAEIKILIITGKINTKPKILNNITILPNISDNDFIDISENADYIISRAGYTTIMDFVTLNKKIILIPTPKQTEQIYLAKYNNKNFSFLSQAEFEKINIENINVNNANNYKNNLLNDIFNKKIDCFK